MPLKKPFNIVPYYCFWGVILRLGVNIRAARRPVLVEGGGPRTWDSRGRFMSCSRAIRAF